VETALYIALGLLVAVAIAMQVWMMRSGVQVIPAERRVLYLFLRVLNIVLVLGVAVLVVYVVTVR
jgi:hypothetical protein